MVCCEIAYERLRNEDYPWKQLSKERNIRLYFLILTVIIILPIVVVAILLTQTHDVNLSTLRNITAFPTSLPPIAETVASTTTLPTTTIPTKTIPTTQNATVCNTKKCIRSANAMRLAMNTKVDPCENFYEYACGNWVAQHPDHGWFMENSAFGLVQEKISMDAIKFFKSKELPDEPLPVKQTRIMYQGCLDQDLREREKYAPVFKILSQLGLSDIPALFNPYNGFLNFDWVITDAALSRMLDLQLFLGFEIRKNFQNHSQTTIMIKKPSRTAGLSLVQSRKSFEKIHRSMIQRNSVSLTEEEEETGKAYFKFQQFMITTLLNSIHYPIPYDINQKIIDIVMFDVGINELPKSPSTDDRLIMITIKELELLTNKNRFIQTQMWERYFNKIFKNTNVRWDYNNDKIFMSTSDLIYFQELTTFLSTKTEAEIEAWVWWSTVTNLVMHTTAEMKRAFEEMDKSTKKNYLPSRDVLCSSLVIKYMDFAMSYSLVDRSFPKTVKPKVENMLKDIKTAFELSVKSLTWMDETTRKATLEKSENMQSYIGYPDWQLNRTHIEAIYSNVKIKKNQHLANLVHIVEHKQLMEIEKLKQPSGKEWHSSPLTVNAFNYIHDNSITIPFGILNFPFYDHGLEVLNYGSLGMVLGHELTHGFDNTGRYFDKDGYFTQWWSNKTSAKFDDFSECFVDQYNNYYIPEIDKHINGKLSLDENIADNGGVHNAYKAYQLHKLRHGKGLELPGLKQFNSDQLFFLSLANMWCDEAKNQILKIEVMDEHCPNQFRVVGSLSNSEAFANAFNCPVGSKMNPLKYAKCKIW